MTAWTWTRWLSFWNGAPSSGSDSAPTTPTFRPRAAACPHCTNLDTLYLHCSDDRCGWLRCTCGALVSAGRRHRHPRHGSGQDTCHDPKAAV